MWSAWPTLTKIMTQETKVNALLAARATPERLRHLAKTWQLSRTARRRAFELAGLLPTDNQWRLLLDRFLLLSGTALIITGIILFFAWNWADLHRFAKFALLEGVLLACVFTTWRQGLDSPVGQVALAAAAMLTGALLAVCGQTYQTGADPYGLFLGWLALILAWALIGRQPGLWLLIVVLANLALILFWEQVLYPDRGFGQETPRLLGPGVWLLIMLSDHKLAQLVFTLNALALAIWEWLHWQAVSWAQALWLPRIIAVFALFSITGASLSLIFASSMREITGIDLLAPLWLVLYIAIALWFYRTRRRDLFMLALCLLALITVVTTFVSRLSDADAELALILALLVIIQTAGATYWLRHILDDWRKHA